MNEIQRPERVLVGDDNRDWADSLARLLRNEGYSVQIAYDGKQALEAAAKLHPHVVLVDLNMPNVGGFEAAGVFARHPRNTRLSSSR